ncbi:class I SAM-dependent RNA methyltransferase [Acidipropionibacterium virtanenii]|uniref:23S rRNA (Uracil-C(5))-methyltransferase RlmCD n=1 Tax=Acidipropionibacterium virtanenii TaxID=2057246 RepID=A0A344UUH8_9ACTN|nr:TRAM domain-containing protein [Acidipropionibacterium virtanenii]AXE38926.1 23S rRNA (uracil-C(5))-methyltransferase RlmCD [Acidipropionibacterium virtanenii]
MSESPAVLDLELGPIAHGGFCVARLQGRVVFVRGGLPGERVRARVIDDSKASHWFATATEVLRADDHRVAPPCPVSQRCGGCDFQHVEPAFQRQLKRRVVSEQLSRGAGIEWDGAVEPAGDDEDGLGWRTRMRYGVQHGRPALRAFRSHDLVTVPEGGCPISHPAGRPAAEKAAAGAAQVAVAVAGALTDDPTVGVVADGHRVEGPSLLVEGLDPRVPLARAGNRSWKVGADGFWQVHPRAATVLAEAVIDGLKPRPGERALDLYCGVGLFAGLLADAGVRVEGVEVSRAAVGLARRNVPGARFWAGRTDRIMPRMSHRADLVVLDPPRKGAGRKVAGQVASVRPRAIAHVACDPAALARDLSLFAENGYRPVSIRAFDLFPMTHHVECVAILRASDDEAILRAQDGDGH